MAELPVLDIPGVEEAGFDAAFTALNALAQHFSSLAQTVADQAARLPAMTRSTWENLCQTGMAGKTEQVHALRSWLAQQVKRRLEMIRQAQAIAERANAFAGTALTGLPDLERARTDLEVFQREVLSRWQTLENLEDLLAEMYPLSNARLNAVRSTMPPTYPQWYAEDSKPF